MTIQSNIPCFAFKIMKLLFSALKSPIRRFSNESMQLIEKRTLVAMYYSSDLQYFSTKFIDAALGIMLI